MVALLRESLEEIAGPAGPTAMPPPVSQMRRAGVDSLKLELINLLASSLIGSPNFKDHTNPTRTRLTALAHRVAQFDGEFLLKAALYTRQELNIRTAANYLLALAASLPSARPFLRKYFGETIRLPSDWIEVAQLYHTLQPQSKKRGTLPAALRKAMVARFTAFDEYQLAKYNKVRFTVLLMAGEKEGNSPRQRHLLTCCWLERGGRMQEAKPAAPAPAALERSESNSSDTEEYLTPMTLTLKRLIRTLHIEKPAQQVMGILGKRYPDSAEAYRAAGLDGEWDATMAGKRMKLRVPETWETQASWSLVATSWLATLPLS
jgi:telomerase protein component 1